MEHLNQKTSISKPIKGKLLLFKYFFDSFLASKPYKSPLDTQKLIFLSKWDALVKLMREGVMQLATAVACSQQEKEELHIHLI